MENTRTIEEIRAERVKVGKVQAAALRKVYRCDVRLSELEAEFDAAAGGDAEAVGRTKDKILKEHGKVCRAKWYAARKMILYRNRLIKLYMEERRCAE